jgi:hypothetical protein
VPFKALIGDRPVFSLACTDAEWAEAQAAGRAGTLRIAHCGHPGHAVFRQGTRYFRHAREEPDCERVAESEEHLRVKAAVWRAVEGFDGWRAAIEEPGAGWEADVLATHEDPAMPRIALEVQLSRQAATETARRDAIYAESGVAAVWLVNEGNNTDAFGSDRRLPLKRSVVLREVDVEAAGRTVRAYLGRVRAQVRAITAAIAEIERAGHGATIERDAAMPAIVSAPSFARPGGVRLVFALAGLQHEAVEMPKAKHGAAPGEPAPAFIRAPRSRYRRLASHALPDVGEDADQAVRSIVADMSAGHLAYQPFFGLYAALVSYEDTCRECFAAFPVCRWAVVAPGDRRPRMVPCDMRQPLPFVVPATEVGWPEKRDGERGQAGWAWNRPGGGTFTELVPAAELEAGGECPGCGRPLAPHKLTEEGALAASKGEPNRAWYWRPERPQPAWLRMKPAPEVPEPAPGTGDRVARRIASEVAAEVAWARAAKAEEAKRQAAERERIRREMEEVLARREREAAEAAEQQRQRDAEAVRRLREAIEAEQREKAEAKRRAEAAARVTEAKELAKGIFPYDPASAEWWLTGAHPGLGGMSPQKAAADTDFLMQRVREIAAKAKADERAKKARRRPR